MAAIMAVLRSCMESFKSILTSQEFGSEYELLCTELSTQWLRVRLWGESVGLHVNDVGHLQNHSFDRTDVESTITQCVQSIGYLLTEIEVLRRKYELRPALLPRFKEDIKSIRASKSMSTLSDFKRPVSSIRQRMRDNQKQTSFLVLTKWALGDAKKFDAKVKRLKHLIHGLEDISQAAGLARLQHYGYPSPVLTTGESPPPYSTTPSLFPRSSITQPLSITQSPTNPAATDLALSCPSIFSHHRALTRFIALSPSMSNPHSIKVRPKLALLSATQFYELCTDVHDDLMRRERYPFVLSLQEKNIYHCRRNQARQKLSSLRMHRFRDLISDVLFELERRFPSLQPVAFNHEEEEGDSLPTSPRRFSTRRYGRVEPPTPPPRLRQRASHSSSWPQKFGPNARVPILTVAIPPRSDKQTQTPPRFSSTLSQVLKSNQNHPTPYTHVSRFTSTRNSTSSTTLATINPPDPSDPIQPSLDHLTHTSPANTTTSSNSIPVPGHLNTVFRSFRVSMNDPTSKVLPAALKKYGINASAGEYQLWIVHGDVERLLGDDEKPLVLFKGLDAEGKKPMFMLRRAAATGGEATVEVETAL